VLDPADLQLCRCVNNLAGGEPPLVASLSGARRAGSAASGGPAPTQCTVLWESVQATPFECVMGDVVEASVSVGAGDQSSLVAFS